MVRGYRDRSRTSRYARDDARTEIEWVETLENQRSVLAKEPSDFNAALQRSQARAERPLTTVTVPSAPSPWCGLRKRKREGTGYIVFATRAYVPEPIPAAFRTYQRAKALERAQGKYFGGESRTSCKGKKSRNPQEACENETGKEREKR